MLGKHEFEICKYTAVSSVGPLRTGGKNILIDALERVSITLRHSLCYYYYYYYHHHDRAGRRPSFNSY